MKISRLQRGHRTRMSASADRRLASKLMNAPLSSSSSFIAARKPFNGVIERDDTKHNDAIAYVTQQSSFHYRKPAPAR